MSLRYLNHLFYRMPVRVTDGEFRVLAYLCDKANGVGEDIYPAYDRLVQWTGFNEEFVRFALRRFKLRGWVSDYSRDGFPRWRLQLPGLVVQRPVENPTEPVQGVLLPDPGIGSDDRRIGISDPVIVGGSPEAARDQKVAAPRIDSPSFVPSSVPSCTSEKQPAALARRSSSSDTPTNLEDIRAQLATLKVRLDAERERLSSRRRRRR